MGRLTALRIARWVRKSDANAYPNLEALIEREAEKVTDGYHYAYWIVPLVGTILGLGVFLPLALLVHPLFGIGTFLAIAIGGGLGAIFHREAKKISPAQIKLRQRSQKVAERLVGIGNLLGATRALSPKVAETLDAAAKAYLSVQPPQDAPTSKNVFSGATSTALAAMDDAMGQMLALGLPESPEAQEVELSKPWVQALLNEMQVSAEALLKQMHQTPVDELEGGSALSALLNARVQLERINEASEELDQDIQIRRS